MKFIFLLCLFFTTISYAIMNEDCIVVNPISNTIVTAGEKMKIAWADSHAVNFTGIYLVQSDGNTKPIVIAENVPTLLGHITVQLPKTLVPSNAYYMTLGTPPNHCQSGNLRIIGASSDVPDPKPPNALDNQITSGRFPVQTTNNATQMKPILLALIILTSCFTF